MAKAERHLTRHGEDRRAEIVREAERLFVEHGYSATRMADIAEAAGVTKGLLYWYFENKQALLAEIIRDMRARLRRAQAAAIAGADDPLGKMYLGTVASTRFVMENQRVYGLIAYVGAATDLGPVQRESTQVHATDTSEIISEGQRLGLIRDNDSPIDLAHGNAGVVNNYCAAYARRQIKGTPEEIGHMAARYVVRSIAATTELAEAVEAAHGLETAKKKRPSKR